LPEGWSKDPESATLATNEDGTLLDLVDQPGAKYWFLIGGSLEQSVEFNSPEEAFDYYEKNMKGKPKWLTCSTCFMTRWMLALKKRRIEESLAH
jgi:hypothetical protein